MPGVLLDREEYVEQAYFFRTYRERLQQNLPAQQILTSIHEEVLSTTRLPYAIEFLRGEILLNGRISGGMSRLAHYFTAFQTFIVQQAEEERARFDFRIALEILEREAEYRAGTPTSAGLFVYQFECISRNRLGFEPGMRAMAEDPLYDRAWADWIRWTRLQLGSIDFSDLVYFRSEQFVLDHRRQTHDAGWTPPQPVLFGQKEGRIARANRGKDPLFMFAALQRQLGYPAIPRPKPVAVEDSLNPAALDARLKLLEKRLSLLEAEVKGNLDISEYYTRSKPAGEEEPPEG